MSPLVQLTAASMRCGLRPDLGGCIAGLWFDDIPVLRSVQDGAITSARQSASFPLVPFSNRVARGEVWWEGCSHAITPNFAPEPHAMHGIGWQRPWTVVEQAPTSASVACVHRADEAWPFAFECVQNFFLAQNSLLVVMTITNRHSGAAPVGLGWHPYFSKRPGCTLAFPALGRWENDEEGLPLHRSASTGLDVDCDRLDVNHCFDGWPGSAVLRDCLLRVNLSSSLSKLVASTHPDKNFIAVEPVSHVSNALGGPDSGSRGIVALQPGESFMARMAVEVAHDPGPRSH